MLSQVLSAINSGRHSCILVSIAIVPWWRSTYVSLSSEDSLHIYSKAHQDLMCSVFAIFMVVEVAVVLLACAGRKEFAASLAVHIWQVLHVLPPALCSELACSFEELLTDLSSIR
jgi:hypothetical protein